MHKSDEDGILYLCRKEVEQACREIDSVAVIREVFALHASNQTTLPDEAYLPWTNEKGEQVRNLNMPAYVGGSLRMAGTKIINGNPGNPGRGLPRASGITLLYDTLSTRVLCMMESAHISSLRTASVTALSVDLFQGKEITCMAVIGAGVLAQAHIELLANRLPHLRQILLFDLESARVKTLQEHIQPVLHAKNIVAQATSTAEEAIRAAQLIVPVTTTTEGYIPFAWLQSGALLVNISLDDAKADVVFGADKLIVDDWHLVKDDPRRLLGRMYRAGQLIGPDEQGETRAHERRRVDAQLGEIVLGTKVGRQHNDEIILVNPFGLAIEDIALATHVYRRALELGLGMFLAR